MPTSICPNVGCERITLPIYTKCIGADGFVDVYVPAVTPLKYNCTPSAKEEVFNPLKSPIITQFPNSLFKMLDCNSPNVLELRE